MENSILMYGLIFMAVIFLFATIFFYIRSSQHGLDDSLDSGRISEVAQTRYELENDNSSKKEEKVNRAVRRSRRRRRKKEEIPLDDRLYHAGIFSEQARSEFKKTGKIAPFLCSGVMLLIMTLLSASTMMTIGGVVLGLLFGIQLPNSILDRKIQARADEIMFYLPLVIEEVAIGVSSSLDVGPCLRSVVEMAEERDCHNVVTELITHVLLNVKTGISLEESLIEVGTKSGHIEVKHAFTALAQVAKHGGEISKQLQDLANAVATQRETEIDGKIKKLELKATGPVALVFLAFIAILLSGFFIPVMKSFKSM